MTKHVLVVDDDPDILDAIEWMLVDAGYEVRTSDKGDSVDNLRDTNGGLPDLIILDICFQAKTAGLSARISRVGLIRVASRLS